jgi:uncharacterized membrane protein
MSSRAGSVAGLGKQRVESLTDGIFGTVMTILGLSLIVPYAAGLQNQPLPALTEILPGVLIYALSFVIMGVFWVGHHVLFHYIRRTDRTLIWLNNLFLLFVGLLPLTTVLLGRHDLVQVTLVAYGLNLIAVQLSLYATWWYATVHHHLVDADLDPAVIRAGRRRILMGPCVSSLAILLTFVDPYVSLGIFVLFPIVFIVPGRIDRFFRRQEHL